MKAIWFGAALAALGILAAGVVQAQAQITIKPRTTAGGWAIGEERWGGKFMRCVAETSGVGNEGLRLAFNPSGDRRLSIAATNPAGFRDRMTFQLSPGTGGLSLAMIQDGDRLVSENPLPDSIVDGLYKARTIDLTLAGNGEQRHYKLGDSETMTAAIDGCISEYAGGGVVAPTGRIATSRGTAGGWAIRQESVDGLFARCTAETTGAGNEGLRFLFYPDGTRHMDIRGMGGAPEGFKDEISYDLSPGPRGQKMSMIQYDGRLRTDFSLWILTLDIFDEARSIDLTIRHTGEKRRHQLGDVRAMYVALDACMVANGANVQKVASAVKQGAPGAGGGTAGSGGGASAGGGQQNIAGAGGGASERVIQTIGEWTLRRHANADGSFARCSISLDRPPGLLRFSDTGKDVIISIPTHASVPSGSKIDIRYGIGNKWFNGKATVHPDRRTSFDADDARRSLDDSADLRIEVRDRTYVWFLRGMPHPTHALHACAAKR